MIRHSKLLRRTWTNYEPSEPILWNFFRFDDFTLVKGITDNMWKISSNKKVSFQIIDDFYFLLCKFKSIFIGIK
jgi:hypothetical protein